MSLDALTCRLCGGEAVPAFTARILAKHEIAYFRCRQCESLETEEPYWLEEAYDGHLGHLDLGAVQRNLTNQAACYLVSRLWRLRNALDYGGGDGLLCRMVRDHGLNCYVWDKYGAPTYAQTFIHPDFDTPDVVFSFEVFEHFVNPATDLDEVFKRGAKVVLASTGLYTDQGNTWFYLSLPSGRHVFFYSRAAIELIGRKFGYSVTISGPYMLFVKPEAANASAIAAFKAMTTVPGLRLLRAFMALKRAPGIAQDSEHMKRRGLEKPAQVSSFAG